MKKVLTTLAIVVFYSLKLNAADLTRRLPNYIVSSSFYGSSITCAASGAISTIAVTGTMIFGVDITSAGSASPLLTLYNSNNSTSVVGTAINSAIDARTVTFHPFNYFASSGIAVANTGGTPACITIYFQDRK